MNRNILVLFEVVSEIGGALSRHAAGNAEISLFETSFLYCGAKPLCRLARLCKDHHSARGTVEPVHQPAIDAVLAGFLFDVLLYCREHIGISRIVGLRGHVLGFDGDEYMPVLMQYDEIVAAEIRSVHEYSSIFRCNRTEAVSRPP